MKIAPNYKGPVVYVPDASRSVPVVQGLLSADSRARFVAEVNADYERLRTAHREKQGPGPLLTLAEARSRGLKTDWGGYRPPRPVRTGLVTLNDYPLAELVDYIDWTPFFATWELTGKYPAILDDTKFGPAARSLFEDAQAMLRPSRLYAGRCA